MAGVLDQLSGSDLRLLAGDTDPQRLADTAWLVAYAMIRTGRGPEAIAQITQGLARPGLTGSQAARLRALQAMTLNATGRIDQAEVAARQALAEAEQAGYWLAAGYALHALSNVSYYRRQEVAALPYIDRALALTEMDLQATDVRLLLLTNKAAHLPNLDRQREAITAARQALALAERTGTPRVHGVRSTLGHLHFEGASGTTRSPNWSRLPPSAGPLISGC